MWEMITDRINLKKSKQYDFRDIEIILTRNLQTDTESIVNAWLKLRGLLSDKTVIDHLPYDLDSEAELAEMDAQNEANIEKNLENMEKMGQDTTNAQLNIETQNKQDNKLTDNQEVKTEVKQDKVKKSDTIKKG